MKRITLIAALVAAFSAQAQTVQLEDILLVPVIASVHVDGDTVDMLWHVTLPDGFTFDTRQAVTGCAVGKGRVKLINGSVGWTLDGTGANDETARITCSAGRRQS